MQIAARSVCALTAIMCVVSCSAVLPVIRVNPMGNLQNGVVFYFSDLFHEHPPVFDIVDVTVLEKQPSGDLVTIWNLHGNESVHSLAYGAKYPGLKPTQPVYPLRRGQAYEIWVYTATGAEWRGAAEFKIDENGTVVSSKP